MNDYKGPQRLQHSHNWHTYADRAGNTLVLLHLLALLHFGASIVTDKLHPHVLLAPAQLGCVDGDKEALHASPLGMLDILLRDLAIAVDITSAS